MPKHNEYMRVARAIARLSDEEVKVGAVLTSPEGTIIWGVGYNTVAGKLVLHAETEAIVAAGDDMAFLDSTIMYLTKAPCVNCARKIAEAGVLKVYYQDPWWDVRGLQILKDAKIQVEQLKRGHK